MINTYKYLLGQISTNLLPLKGEKIQFLNMFEYEIKF